jgi:hypothetical protein
MPVLMPWPQSGCTQYEKNQNSFASPTAVVVTQAINSNRARPQLSHRTKLNARLCTGWLPFRVSDGTTYLLTVLNIIREDEVSM